MKKRKVPNDVNGDIKHQFYGLSAAAAHKVSRLILRDKIDCKNDFSSSRKKRSCGLKAAEESIQNDNKPFGSIDTLELPSSNIIDTPNRHTENVSDEYVNVDSPPQYSSPNRSCSPFDNSPWNPSTLPTEIPSCLTKFSSSCPERNQKSIKISSRCTEYYFLPGEYISIVGLYDLFVVSGKISLWGAYLQSSRKIYRVYAPISHPIPAITCPNDLTNTFSIVRIRTVSLLNQSPQCLRSISKLFDNIWAFHDSETETDNPTAYALPESQQSYQVVESIFNNQINYPVNPLIFSECWLKTIVSLITKVRNSKSPVIFIGGGKRVGKSVFCRALINGILTRETIDSTSPFMQSPNIVFFLDLDPNSQEYTPPSQISLLLVRYPNFGPAFTHTHTSIGNGNICVGAHAVRSDVMRDTPDDYLCYAEDLLLRYRKLRSLPVWGCQSRPSTAPLIIKAPSSNRGFRDRILSLLLSRFQKYLTDIVTLSTHASSPLAKLNFPGTLINTYPCDKAPSSNLLRSASELNEMSIISYFHSLDSPYFQTRWDSSPITTLSPLFAKCAGLNSSFFAILVHWELEDLTRLDELLDSSLIALTILQNDPSDELSSEIYIHQSTQVPFLLPTTTNQSTILHPSLSRTIGWAYIKNFDSKLNTLEIITPISSHILANLPGNRTILQLGLVKQPTWIFTELIQSYHNNPFLLPKLNYPWLRQSNGPEAKAFQGIYGSNQRVRPFQPSSNTKSMSN